VNLPELELRAASNDLIGIFKGISNEDYHAGPGVSRSSFDLIDRSVMHYDTRKNKETKARAMGTWFHTMMLEPEQVASSWVIGPAGVNWGTIKYGDLAEANPGRQVVPQDIYDQFCQQRERAMRKPRVRQFIETGINELTGYHRDMETGMLVKVRPDQFCPDFRILTDWKTSDDASPAQFTKDLANYGYVRQGAHNLDSFNASYRQENHKKFNVDPGDVVDTFVLIVSETVEPYECALYVLHPEDLAIARVMNRNSLYKLAQARQTGSSQAYPDEIQTLRAPGWWGR